MKVTLLTAAPGGTFIDRVLNDNAISHEETGDNLSDKNDIIVSKDYDKITYKSLIINLPGITTLLMSFAALQESSSKV